MIYRRSKYARMPGGYIQFRSGGNTVHGCGEGDYIRLRDEFGRVWVGSAVCDDGDIVRYRFRDPDGRYITGIADGGGLLLRDERGKTWRGFLE